MIPYFPTGDTQVDIQHFYNIVPDPWTMPTTDIGPYIALLHVAVKHLLDRVKELETELHAIRTD